MNIAIIGSRSFTNYNLLNETIYDYCQKNSIDIKSLQIVSGGAIGADKLGEKFAKNNNLKTLIFLPDWAKHGRKAGILRNADIIDNSNVIFAFWDGQSKGTLNSINRSKKQNKELYIINY
jgi:hypothetical protein